MNISETQHIDTDDTVRDIKKELRAAMNGILSAQMRQAGMPYKLIFGVELPRLRDIATEFTPSRQLAQALWNLNIRECKLLACLMMPKDELLPEVADIWLEEAPAAECIQLMVMSLLAPQPWAAEWAFRWIATENSNRQQAGFLIMARLLAQGAELNSHSLAELQNQADSLLPHANLHLRKAITATLRNL